MTYIRDNLILLWASPKTAGNFVEDVLDKSSLSEIYGPVDIECSLTSGSPSVNAMKKVKSTGQRTRWTMQETINTDHKNSPLIFIVSCILLQRVDSRNKISWCRILLLPVSTFLHILAETYWMPGTQAQLQLEFYPYYIFVSQWSFSASNERSTPIWTAPNSTTPNWTTPFWTNAIWTEVSFGLTPIGLTPFGLTPIGLTPFGLPPIGLIPKTKWA